MSKKGGFVKDSYEWAGVISLGVYFKEIFVNVRRGVCLYWIYYLTSFFFLFRDEWDVRILKPRLLEDLEARKFMDPMVHFVVSHPCSFLSSGLSPRVEGLEALHDQW